MMILTMIGAIIFSMLAGAGVLLLSWNLGARSVWPTLPELEFLQALWIYLGVRFLLEPIKFKFNG